VAAQQFVILTFARGSLEIDFLAGALGRIGDASARK
jgi:hypothetical protein